MPREDKTATPEVETHLTAEELARLEAEEAPVPEPIVSPVAPEPTEKKKAVIVVAGGSVPSADIKIVVESRKYATDADGVVTSEVKKSHYPTGADTYVAYDPDVQFPKDAAEVLVVGRDLQQHNFWGFTRQAGSVNVGPAHAAYVAANLAYQRGATDIEIIGLTDGEKALLKPFFDDLPNNPVEPAKVAVSFT